MSRQIAPTLAMVLTCMLLASSWARAGDTKEFRNAAVHRKYSVQEIAPKNAQPYLRRGPRFPAHQAKLDGYTWVKGHEVTRDTYRRAHLRSVGQWDRVEILLGTTVSEAAKRISDDAKRTGKPTRGRFNGIMLYAMPGDSARKAKNRWQAGMDQAVAKRKQEAAVTPAGK